MLVAVVLVVGFVFSLPTSMHGLSAAVPQVAALKPYRFWGCGVAGSNTATKTHFYQDLKADSRLRSQLREEMLSRAFREETRAGTFLKDPVSTVYVRSSGGLFPIRSYVIVGADGAVCTGASRSKWPQL